MQRFQILDFFQKLKELVSVILLMLIAVHGGLLKFDLHKLLILKIYENKRHYANNGIKGDLYMNVRTKQMKWLLILEASIYARKSQTN